MSKTIKLLNSFSDKCNARLLLKQLKFNTRSCSTCSNTDNNLKCNKSKSHLRFRSSSCCSVSNDTTCSQSELKLTLPKLTNFFKENPCKSACNLTRKRWDLPTSSSSMVWKKQSSNVSYKCDIEQASFDLYQRSIKPYTRIRKIIGNNFRKREKKISLDPTEEDKIGITKICSINMFSIGSPIQDPTCRNHMLCNEHQLCKREYSNMNYNTNNSIKRSKFKNNVKCKCSYSTDSRRSKCPKCKKCTGCVCKNNPTEKYGKLIPKKHKRKSDCGKQDSEETSCGLIPKNSKKTAL
ncbi:hypothetical protein ILUMI_24074 [Ignelater luminosus]|uniref:Uncharacterized protein n=1 Tax=Ignelater luminosus TaxID=2038154 RepID=A0A8K0CB55_IGNLU|nr:hypothetical protein ILUMI_24074 [Ignelater luminosus]